MRSSSVKYVETAGSNPSEHLPVFQRAAVNVIHKYVSVRHAVKPQRMGLIRAIPRVPT